MNPWLIWLSYLCGLMALGALAYHALCLLGARDFRRQQVPAPGAAVPVSILKPLKGADPQMYESFRSHCRQDYPAYEIIFGVNEAGDEAVPYVERLKAEYPQVPIRLVVCSTVLGANRKVSNVAQMLGLAKHDHILINDSDICVGPDYLRRVMPWFEPNRTGAKKIGMVTCMYRAVAGKTVWSKVESLGVTMDFMPPVLGARFLEGRVYFGLGSTLAVSKEAVKAMGGVETLVDHLADDYELGTRITDAGYEVVLSDVIVETYVHDYTWRQFIDHQLRWARTVRSSRPGGYFGTIITFGIFWSLLAMLFSAGAGWSLALLVANLVARVVVLWRVGDRIIGHGAAWRLLWLIPLREVLAPYIWLGGLIGDRIVWRGETFRLVRGKLVRV
jgi:ceramide glucosyltransferase